MARGVLLVYLLLQCMVILCSANDTTKGNKAAEKQLKLEPLLGYNFGNRGSWANITPEVFLGFDTLIYIYHKNHFRLRFGPTVSASNVLLDSSNYYKGIMLPGLASLSMNVYATRNILQDKIKLSLLSGCGLKIAGYTTNNESVAQNNVKAGIGLELIKLFSVSAEHTWGWHNLTNETERTFKRMIRSEKTNVRYFTLNVEGYSQAMDVFIVFSWRKMLRTAAFCDAEFDNDRIVSVGIRKDMSFFSQGNNP